MSRLFRFLRLMIGAKEVTGFQYDKTDLAQLRVSIVHLKTKNTLRCMIEANTLFKVRTENLAIYV